MFRVWVPYNEPSNSKKETAKVSWRWPARGGRDHHRWETLGPPECRECRETIFVRNICLHRWKRSDSDGVESQETPPKRKQLEKSVGQESMHLGRKLLLSCSTLVCEVTTYRFHQTTDRITSGSVNPIECELALYLVAIWLKFFLKVFLFPPALTLVEICFPLLSFCETRPGNGWSSGMSRDYFCKKY